MHVRYKETQRNKINNSGTLNDTLNGTLKNNLINIIKINPSIKQIDIASKLNVSVRTVKRIMKDLIDNNIIERVGSKKTGSWKIKKL